MKTMWHKRHDDFESFDKITMELVERYKTSELSGNEWRFSVAIRFWFKGECVHEKHFNGMQSAIMMLPSEWLRAQEPIPQRVIDIEEAGACSQPACTEKAVGRFKLKRLFSERGDALDPADVTLNHYREFCKRHVRRGDCGREDCDNNYEPLDGLTAEDSTNREESPSAVMMPDGEIYVQKEPETKA